MNDLSTEADMILSGWQQDALSPIRKALGPGCIPRHNGIDLIAVGRAAVQAHTRVVETGATLMVKQPWRIGRVLYGRSEWPLRRNETTGTGPWLTHVVDVTPVEALADCAARLAGRRADPISTRALLQAERALLSIITAEG
jgi:hypothetical protein